MYNKWKIYGLAVLLTTAASCQKYLDVAPKGKIILTNVSDYDLFLNSQDLTSSGARELNVMSDEVDIPAIPAVPEKPEDLAYLWALQFTTDTKTPPLFWGKHYGNIYRFNAVLQGIDAAGNGTEQDKRRIRAEALLGRAFEYLYLVNLYAKPYNAATASQDLAVPFMTSIDIADKTPPRSTVEEIYDHIFNDIKAAIPDLPANNAGNRFRGAVPAAYSVLARACLYTGRYEEAAQNARLALGDKPPAILDYNTIASKAAIPAMAVRPFDLYARYSTNASFREYPTITMLKMFDVNDLRLKLFYEKTGDYTYPQRGVANFNPSGATTNFGTGVEEMKLIIAEAAARSGKLEEALTQVNDIRKCRIKKEVYQPLTSTNKEDVLGYVFRERQLELAFRGLRWFDMRRLDAENKMPAVTRYGAGTNVITTLPPHGARYVLQIPSVVLQFNPDMPRNAE
ncbi:RagB/SusD family nutrient uptake outer membrane protein [Chitinophaga qingshengii]|uniref:RagB/SusD family nutrient uptake outer membrane protein n=1 Tax=Chitinophaga qingshengii TaxID=1569794 RepID=A0ABR7TR98_9BACT|nr:RagB/SusD family nutrient uptake outer membrane protein [Chitinophaga qingshengii]MBC9932082.1 RagB/SusD family nutrient uptake outer membrane protein [Chitinophaga qingshengii]